MQAFHLGSDDSKTWIFSDYTKSVVELDGKWSMTADAGGRPYVWSMVSRESRWLDSLFDNEPVRNDSGKLGLRNVESGDLMLYDAYKRTIQDILFRIMLIWQL